MIRDLTFAAIDFEAAGAVKGQADVPIQIGIATGGVDREPVLYDTFLAIDRPVSRGAQRVHGISDAQLVGSPSLLQIFPDLKEHLDGRPLVAHAHGTEKRFLGALPGHSFGPWIDTLTLSRKIYPTADSHRLGRVCESLGLASALESLVPGRGWHDALFDAAASLLLLLRVIDELNLADQPLSVLR